MDLIHSYSRKQAIEDGFQVEIPSKITQEAGIKFPVYMTRTAYDKYVEVPKELEGCQNLEGRLWDILYMFALTVRKEKTDSNTIEFNFICQLPDKGDWESNEKLEQNRNTRLITLIAVVGPKDIDDSTPAITIMKPNED